MKTLLLALLLGSGAQVLQPAPPSSAAVVEDAAVTALALKIYRQMRTGRIDPALVTPEMNAELNPALLAQYKPVFDQLGDPLKATCESSERHTKGTLYGYLVTFAAAQFHIKIFIHPDGKFAGYGLEP